MKKDPIISTKEVEHVAKLANLPLSKDQIEQIQKELDVVLEYMSKIQAINTKGIAETHQVTGLTNVFREDKIEEEFTLTQQEALQNSKNTHNGYFVVDGVLN